MVDRNILTLNPGWRKDAKPLPKSTDVRDLQPTLKAKGVTFVQEADDATNGPRSPMVADAHADTILLDQHV